MRLTLIIISFLLFASPSWADVITTTSTEYYTVNGKSKNAILKDIEKQFPKLPNGKFKVAHTQSTVKWDYSWTERNGLCTITKVIVSLHIIYKYPKLSQTPDKKTLKWWKNFLQETEEHELIHGDISIKSANEMDKKLNAIGDVDCYNVKSIIKVRANRIIKKMEKNQNSYDMLTDNGIKQQNYKSQ